MGAIIDIKLHELTEVLANYETLSAQTLEGEGLFRTSINQKK